MCDIAGLVGRNDSAEQREMAVRAMCEAMRHRAPDASGDISRGPATLGTNSLFGHDVHAWSRAWSLAVLVAFLNRRHKP